MFELEDTHFWFIGKHYFIDSVLSEYKSGIKNILDLGSGTGGTTEHLKKYGRVTGIENYDYAIKLARSRGLNIKKGNLNNLKVKSNSFDLVTIFDVLYHQNIKNEKEILKKCNNVLKNGGYLLIIDSALSILKSQHDVFTQGKRRYLLAEMIKLVEKQNFEVIKASYIYFSIFPLVAIKRLIIDKIFGERTSDVKPVSEFTNKLLLRILKFESKLLKHVTFPIGSSVVLLAVKNERLGKNKTQR